MTARWAVRAVTGFAAANCRRLKAVTERAMKFGFALSAQRARWAPLPKGEAFLLYTAFFL